MVREFQLTYLCSSYFQGYAHWYPTLPLLYHPSRVLQSSFYSNLWQVSRANVIFGSRSFRVAAPTIWNTLASWSVYLTHLILTNSSTLIRIFCKQLLCGLAPGRINSNVVIVISLTVSLISDSEWQWHQLGHMQVCTLLQTDNHASTPPLSFLQAGCPSCHPTNSVKALKSGLQTISKALSKCLRFGIFCVNVLLYLVGRKLVGLCCWCLLDFRAHFLSDLHTYKRRLCFYYTVNFVLVYHIVSVVPVITERCCIPKM